MFDKSTKKKEDRMSKIAIRNAGMKQDDIARVLNVSQSVVSRLLKEHRESGSKKRSTLILECKELLLKHYGTWCNIWRPPDTVKGGYWDIECSEMTLLDLTVLASSRNTKINRTSLVFHRRACCRT